MNVYALFPLVAVIAFIPLLVTSIASRPHRRQQKLFILFLIPAMMWSLADYIWRSNFFPDHIPLLSRITIVAFTLMAVQFHCFSSSFFSAGEKRLLPLAYGTLAMVIVMAAVGYFPRAVVVAGDKLYPDYGTGVLFLAGPLFTLLGRNMHVFLRRLRNLDSPVLYNQILSLVIGLTVLTVFTLAALLPSGREFPISHVGNIVNAVILSYATIRHKLVDIKFVIRGGLVWACVGAIGIASYWLVMLILQKLLHNEIDLTTAIITSLVAVFLALGVYKLRGLLFQRITRAFDGQKYDYRQKLTGFSRNIDRFFSLNEQGVEFLALVTRAVGCRKACLLFPEAGSDDYTAQLVEPVREDNPLNGFRLSSHNPIVEYLRRERSFLTRMNLAVLPEFHSLWAQEKEAIRAAGIEVFIPLVSRDRLAGVLILDRKFSGIYTLEDYRLLEDAVSRVAVSLEKEYIHDQLREREKELSVINRSSSIIASSLDIRRNYDSFIRELKQVVDVSWAAITVIEGDEICFLALSSEVGSAWQVGERIPLKGAASEWVSAHKVPVIESNLAQESRFTTGKYLLDHGIRSIAYLPLIIRGQVIGCLVVGSCVPSAYSPRHLKLLDELAAQIAVAIENSRLYAKAEEMARIDGLTGLLNRNSLDEQMSNEINRHSRYGGEFSLIILDLDSFKDYNDHYGHLAGDELLKQVGTVMKGAIRGADQAFRYGGDEFAVLLPQTNTDAAYLVAERIRKRASVEANAGSLVTVSLGLASWPADGITVNEVIAAADTALYHAKRSGSNQSQQYSPALAPANHPWRASPGAARTVR